MTIYAVEFIDDGYHSKAFSKRENVTKEILIRYCDEVIPCMIENEHYNKEDIASQIKTDILQLINHNYIEEYAYVNKLEVEDME